MGHGHNHEDSFEYEKQRVASLSMAASAGLSLLKFIAALLTGSLGLLSEAVHSLVDFGATAITWFAVRWAAAPADDDHHFGHAKIESVAAFFETLLLLGIAAFIAYEAIHRLITGTSEVEVTWWAMAILVISILVDLNRSRALARTAKTTASEALAADAAHFQSDMWGSAAVLLGLFGVWFGFKWADSVAALLVSAVIARIGWQLGKTTLASLLDTVPGGVAADIRDIANSVDSVLGVDQLRVKPNGPILFVNLIITLSRMLAGPDVQEIKSKLTAAIKLKYPNADVTISTNPISLDTETAFDKVGLIARQRKFSVHHLTVQDIAGRLAVSFDLEVDGSSNLESAHAQATALEEAIRAALGGDVEVESHIEPLPLRLLAGHAADAKIAATVEKQLRTLAKSEKLLSDIHNVRVRLTEGGLFVHYHCRFAPQQTIDTVHSVVDRIENALQTKIKNIHRVVAHAEPTGQERHTL